MLQYALAAEEGESEEGTLRLALQRRLDLGLDEADDAITRVKNVRFRFVLANDYRIEVASDRQNSRIGIPEFLVVTRAAGNVKNQLNPREVVFDYGLPTASQIAGITAEVRDWWGFDLYGEFNVSTQYRQFPSTTRESHRSFSGIQGDEPRGWLAVQSRGGTQTLGASRSKALAWTTPTPLASSRWIVAAWLTTRPKPPTGSTTSSRTTTIRTATPTRSVFSRADWCRRNRPALGGFQVRSDGVPDPAVFPWVRRKWRLHLRLQSKQQRRPGEFLPRLRRAFSAPPLGPARVPLWHRPQQQRLGRAL